MKTYSPDLKVTVVKEALAGVDSIRGLTKKYGITDHHLICDWIKIYKAHGASYFYEDHRKTPKKANLDELPLEEQVERLKMEVAILKKLKALM